MADDKTNISGQDLARVAGGQNYEVLYLARETGITPEQARQLISAYGNDREKLMKAAKGLAGRRPSPRSSRV